MCFETEIDILRRLVDRFEGFEGVWLEDSDGNVIDMGYLTGLNSDDTSTEVHLIIDADRYTENGFQRTCSRVSSIISDGDY